MTTPDTEVKVVIPIYKAELSPLEQASLDNTFTRLGRYPIVLLVSEDIDSNCISERYRSAEIMRISNEWLGRKNGICGYNRMMLDKRFYDAFADCRYILVCHLDAWIFRDELSDWCARGYDYVAAPWAKRPIYNFAPVKTYLYLRRKIIGKELKFMRQDLFNKVGNGGLSLRKVKSFRHACDVYAEQIGIFNSKASHLYNEDVFWALAPSEFKYPALQEALRFSFDVNPRLCYRLSGYRLPFGCHGLSYGKIYKFWKNFIHVPQRLECGM